VVKDTVRLGRIAGVGVGLHWSVLVLGALAAEQLAGRRFPARVPGYSIAEYQVTAVATAAVFLGCVLVHEVSHAVVARRRGVGVDGITLWLLGGATRMTSDPATPMAELAVAGIGPLTSFALGAVMIGFAIAGREGSVSPLLVDALTWLGVINLVLAVFNALPGAPLDGGRVLHALVWRRRNDEQHATRVASRAGQILGTILIAFGLFEFAFAASGGTGLWIALIGWFLLSAARAEAADATTHRVGDIVQPLAAQGDRDARTAP
jgi:Zn-dependent protease